MSLSFSSGHFKSFRIFVTVPVVVLHSFLTKRAARLCTFSMSFICFECAGLKRNISRKFWMIWNGQHSRKDQGKWHDSQWCFIESFWSTSYMNFTRGQVYRPARVLPRFLVCIRKLKYSQTGLKNRRDVILLVLLCSTSSLMNKQWQVLYI